MEAWVENGNRYEINTSHLSYQFACIHFKPITADKEGPDWHSN